jgi:hypothetical protein
MHVRALLVALLIFSVSAFAQSQFPPAPHAVEQLDEIRKHPCDIQVPEGFSCAVLLDVCMSYFDGMIASIVGEDVTQVSVYRGGMLYTIGYDPPLKRDDKFFHLRRGTHVPVRIDRNDVILQWPDRTRSKGKIIRREAIFPDQPQPA